MTPDQPANHEEPTPQEPAAAPGWPPPDPSVPAAHVPPASPPRKQNWLQRAWAPVAAALAAGAKFAPLVFKVKGLGLLLSMLVSALAYTAFYGWTFAVGLVALILVHELGHFVLFKVRGFDANLPVFVPLFGAVTTARKEGGISTTDSAATALAGPAFGGAASAAVLFLGVSSGSGFLHALGYFSLVINIFNMAPVGLLDGGQATRGFTRYQWLAIVGGLVLVEVAHSTPTLILLLVFAAYQLFQTWRKGPREVLPPQEQLTVFAVYVALLTAMVWCMEVYAVAERKL